MVTDKKKSKFYWFYRKYFKNRKLSVLLMLVMIVIGVTTSNLGPLLYGRMIDFITGSNLEELRKYILLYFVVTMGSLGLGIIEGYMGQFLTFRVTNEVKKDLLSKIVRMRFRKLDQYTAGELISRLENDADAIVSYYMDLVTSIVLIAINLVISLYFVFTISIKLSTISIFFIPASSIVTLIFRKKFRVLAEKQKEYGDKYFGFINETFTNLKGVRAYQLEDTVTEEFNGFIHRSFALMKRSMFLGNTMGIINQTITLIFTLSIIYFSAVLIMQGMLTIGSMVAFNTYIDKLFSAVSRLLSLNLGAQSVIVSLDRLNTLDNEPDERALHHTANASPPTSFSCVSLENVCFGYDEMPVIRDMSFKWDTPGLYCLVGENGCGKSTLAKLLLRFYDCGSGTIKYGDTDIQDVSMNELRDNFLYIAKEVFLMNDTLMNNVKLASPKATDQEVKDACEKVGLASVVENLANGYETKLGENGSLLSSGQKQKVNAARMVLRKSPLIFLDEVTSDLDGAAEKEILTIIQEIAKESMVFMVSHRASTVMSCDHICVMFEGRIIADGVHEELLRDCELYHNLFATMEARGNGANA